MGKKRGSHPRRSKRTRQAAAAQAAQAAAANPPPQQPLPNSLSPQAQTISVPRSLPVQRQSDADLQDLPQSPQATPMFSPEQPRQQKQDQDEEEAQIKDEDNDIPWQLKDEAESEDNNSDDITWDPTDAELAILDMDLNLLHGH